MYSNPNNTEWWKLHKIKECNPKDCIPCFDDFYNMITVSTLQDNIKRFIDHCTKNDWWKIYFENIVTAHPSLVYFQSIQDVPVSSNSPLLK